MEEAAADVSEASFCLQSILPPPECFPPAPPRLRRGGCGAPRGFRRLPASGSERRGRARLLSPAAGPPSAVSSPARRGPRGLPRWLLEAGEARAACGPGRSLGAGAGPSQRETRGLPSYFTE